MLIPASERPTRYKEHPVPGTPLAIPAQRPAELPETGERTGTARLGSGHIGLRGEVVAIRAPDEELERILLEIGFIEGARVEILHEGPFGRDPIAVRVDDMRVALRRREATAVWIRTPAGRAAPSPCRHG